MARLVYCLRHALANALLRLSLAALPSERVRADILEILAGYRAGVEAVVLLDMMRRVDFFTADDLGCEFVDDVERTEKVLH